MGLMDAFNAEDRVTLKVSDYAKVLKEGVKADLMMNAVTCEVPYQYIREMMSGIKEENKIIPVPVDVLPDVLMDVLEEMISDFEEEEDDEPVCGDDDTEERCEGESCESGSGTEDGCDEDHGSEGAGLES